VFSVFVVVFSVLSLAVGARVGFYCEYAISPCFVRLINLFLTVWTFIHITSHSVLWLFWFKNLFTLCVGFGRLAYYFSFCSIVFIALSICWIFVRPTHTSFPLLNSSIIAFAILVVLLWLLGTVPVRRSRGLLYLPGAC